MPVVKITNTSKGSNKGTCAFLEKYLQKENADKEFSEQSFWYDQERNYVSRGEVVNRIDGNHKGLRKDDAKFFMITINYSEKELTFLTEKYTNSESLSKFKKEYCREVMSIYADNFNKNLDSKDILFFAMDESNRYHKGDSIEVQKGDKKQGSTKDGHNDHTHIVVSRKDKAQRLKLSPLTNHMDTQKGAVKGGFNRVDFKLACETAFDKMINYNRDFEEKAEFLIKKSRGEIMINEREIKPIVENNISIELIDIKHTESKKVEKDNIFNPLKFKLMNIPMTPKLQPVEIIKEVIQIKPEPKVVEPPKEVTLEPIIPQKVEPQTVKKTIKNKNRNNEFGMGF